MMEFAHADSAWTQWYTAPKGVEADECYHRPNRMRVGPTSRKRGFMILVDYCKGCGRITRSIQDLSWKEYDWVRRSNNRVELGRYSTK